jgi:acyl-CoA synthetase (AMP-forming)/AMP-acid ligase II
MTMEPHLLFDAFRSAVEARPAQLAVVDDRGTRTYGELGADVERVARGLLAQGLRPGDRIAFQLPNGAGWLSSFWGALVAGCVAVPLNIRNRPAEVAYMLDQCEASAILTADPASLAGIGARPLTLDDVTSSWGEDGDREDRRAESGPDEVCLIVFTSGSTGYPKGAMLTHEGLLADGSALRAAWRLGDGEAVLVPSPLSHVLGLMAGCVVLTLANATLLTMSAFDAGRALDLINRHRAVGATGTPTHYLMMVEHPDLARCDTSCFRFAMYGGAPFAPEAARRVVAGMGAPTLLGGYGMSETSGGVTSVSLDDPLELQLTTVGHALAPFEVKIVDSTTGREQPCGEVGELWVRGRPVMKGYWGNPEETARALTEDGWLRTGDLLTMDSAGYLRFAGRIREMLTVGGYNVYPAEVERVLAQHPAVAEASVVGVPHHLLGEVPFAFVRLHDDQECTSEELIAFCGDLIADYKVPRSMAFVESFPVSGSGKVEKFKQREAAQALVPADVRSPAARPE